MQKLVVFPKGDKSKRFHHVCPPVDPGDRTKVRNNYGMANAKGKNKGARHGKVPTGREREDGGKFIAFVGGA